MTKTAGSHEHRGPLRGALRIGDQWNAIAIIALSQNNPLKAIAEFVENSIDARARHITITRGKEKGKSYLRIKDDGEGIRRDAHGRPDFAFVATHICDSIKRQMKREGTGGLQGEFGIGLLSFWTVGEELWLSSAGADGRLYQMHMRKGDPKFTITDRKVLVAEPGTELVIRPILPGIRQLSGEKIQWYLASELRDRIRHSGAEVRVVDRAARAEYRVEPRQFGGRLLHELPSLLPPQRELYLEIYLSGQDPAHAVGLYKSGTRILENIAELPAFQKAPWTSGYLQGIVDAATLNLTPGTRTGVIQDEAFHQLVIDLEPVSEALLKRVDDQRRAEEERASQDVLRSVQKALKEALMVLPSEEYDWFEIRSKVPSSSGRPGQPGAGHALAVTEASAPSELREESDSPQEAQKQFFEFAGPLFSVRISPASSVVPVEGQKSLRAVARDRARHLVEANVSFEWELLEGPGQLVPGAGEMALFSASKEPGLVRIKVTARQGEVACSAEALITVVQSLVPADKVRERPAQGIPSYTYQKAPGELWRSRFEADQNVIVINNGHRDFVFASKNKALKLRYICRLFAKEMVLANFSGAPATELLERLIELSLYTEENLK